jgi:aryl-alcohol dehydrogenase-like predicted oxidoreductase
MPLSNDGRPSEQDALKVIHAALDVGVNFIDTANVYCQNSEDLGHNERLIAHALKDVKPNREIFVATKGGLTRTPSGDWALDGNPTRLREACERSLKNLGVEHIFLYQLHAPDANFAWNEQIFALARLKEEGKIRHIGISNVTAAEIGDAQNVTRIETVQNRWNLMSKADRDNGVFDLCHQFGMTYIAYSPVGGGYTHRELARDQRLGRLAQKYDASPYQIMLAWALAQGDFILPIPGARRQESIIDSVKSAALTLRSEDISLLEQISE